MALRPKQECLWSKDMQETEEFLEALDKVFIHQKTGPVEEIPKVSMDDIHKALKSMPKWPNW